MTYIQTNNSRKIRGWDICKYLHIDTNTQKAECTYTGMSCARTRKRHKRNCVIAFVNLTQRQNMLSRMNDEYKRKISKGVMKTNASKNTIQ